MLRVGMIYTNTAGTYRILRLQNEKGKKNKIVEVKLSRRHLKHLAYLAVTMLILTPSRRNKNLILGRKLSHDQWKFRTHSCIAASSSRLRCWLLPSRRKKNLILGRKLSNDRWKFRTHSYIAASSSRLRTRMENKYPVLEVDTGRYLCHGSTAPIASDQRTWN